MFKDKIVLIGLPSQDSANDVENTPLGIESAGRLLIHAQIVNQFLRAALNGEHPAMGVPAVPNGLGCFSGASAGSCVGFFVRSHIIFGITSRLASV